MTHALSAFSSWALSLHRANRPGNSSGRTEKGRLSTSVMGGLFKYDACFFGSSATCYFSDNGSVSFVPLEFLPSLPFRKQAKLNISSPYNLSR